MKLRQKQETTEKTGEIELQEEQKTLEYNMKQRRNSTGKKENNKRGQETTRESGMLQENRKISKKQETRETR